MDEPQVKFSRLDEQGRWVLIGNYNALLAARKANQIRPDTIVCGETVKGAFDIMPAGKLVKWLCETKEGTKSKAQLDFDEVRNWHKRGASSFRWGPELYADRQLEEIVKLVEEADNRSRELKERMPRSKEVLTEEPAATASLAIRHSETPTRKAMPAQSGDQNPQFAPAAPLEPPLPPDECLPFARDSSPLPLPSAPFSGLWDDPDASASLARSAAPPATSSHASKPSQETKPPSRFAAWTLVFAVSSLMCLAAILGSQWWWYEFGFQKELDKVTAKSNEAGSVLTPTAAAKTADDTAKKQDLAALKTQIDQSTTALNSRLDQSTTALKSQLEQSGTSLTLQVDRLTTSLKPQIDQSTTSLKSQIAQSADSLSAKLGDDAKQASTQLAQVRKDLLSLSESLAKIDGEGKQRGDQTAKDLKDVQGQIAENRRQVRLAEGQLERLSASLQVPPDERLAAVLVMIDSGQRMRQYDYPAVRQAVFETVEAALRQTPRRKIGVAANRGDRLATLLAPDVHFRVPDLELFRKELAEHQAAAGEESVRSVGVQSALDLMVPRGGKWRLVYVTCTPLRHADPEPEKWRRFAEISQKYAVEVWAIHLLKTDEEPSQDLLNLATATGGQYVALCVKGPDAGTAQPSSSATERGTTPTGTAESLSQRLSQLLCQPLDLPPLRRTEP